MSKKKKKYKLKNKFKIFLVILIIFGICGYFGLKKYNEYLYTLTNEYALLKLGYSLDDSDLFAKKLSDKEIKEIISLGYDEFLPKFVSSKYFMFKNLSKYLDNVKTEEEDFFYHDDPETVDYDNIVAIVNTHANEEVYSDTYSTDFDKGYAILSNKYYKLGEDYEPDDLVSIDWKYRFGTESDVKYIRSEVYDKFVEMWNAAYNDGIYLLVDSAYRSASKQKEVYEYYENLKGTSYADSIAARPGYSEHQTGLSLDIYSKECSSGSTFKDSTSYKWLIENSYKYGFILRYPENKEKITGYNYESWHYRYLGVDLATKVYNENISYDEYYAFYLEDK